SPSSFERLELSSRDSHSRTWRVPLIGIASSFNVSDPSLLTKPTPTRVQYDLPAPRSTTVNTAFICCPFASMDHLSEFVTCRPPRPTRGELLRAVCRSGGR